MTATTPPILKSSSWSVAATAAIAAFGAYFCMYAFRKPFTVAEYQAITPLGGIDFKTVLVVAQVFGYMLSKFIGIRFIAEVRSHQRVRALLIQIGLAECSLLLFALTPAPYSVVWLFANGLCLGMIFGLIMVFLEGRRNTEALIAGLCAGFIVADGAVKSVGAALLAAGVTESWMPFAAGLLFVLPLLGFCALLQRVPPPDARDIEARSERAPMTAVDRRRFLRRYGVGLGLIVFVFLLVTILRSVRADFAPEIWDGLGVKPDAGLYARSEIAVAFAVLALNGATAFLHNNRVAFFAALAIAAFGLLLTAAVVEGLKLNLIAPFPFMVLLGIGIYLPYIAVHTTVFERFIAMTRDRGTIGFLMYLADAFGYLGYVAVLLARQLFQHRPSEGMLPFILTLCTIVALTGAAILIPAARYFLRLRSSP